MTRLLAPDDHLCVLITGISASGKSTVAELLARRFWKGAHVKGDAFRRMVVSGRREMSADPEEEAVRQLKLRYRLGASAADGYFQAGFSVVVQDIVIGPALLDYLKAITSRPLALVVLCPTLEAVATREAGRVKSAYGPDRVSAEALDTALRKQTPEIGLWVDSSDLTAQQTVDHVADRLWSSALVD
ncbi:MAG TPA: AAA family ATPase [Acidimicrobiales bacterium]|nr:AAA family ATPase [Acidimicrobiales bacterium]